mgnify:CR=1 FL=1
MELRNVISYILTFDNKPINNDTFKEYNIRLSESFSAQRVNENFENALYYIFFNHYANFLTPAKLKSDKVTELLQNINLSFDAFKDVLRNRFIQEDRHKSFLSGISQRMGPLEKMRNSIMHFRNITSNTITNYLNAARDTTNEQGEITNPGILTIIRQFWEDEKEILKEQTWLALAKSLIEQLITKIEEENVTIYNLNQELYDDEFEEEGYLEIDDFRANLITYLIDNVAISDEIFESNEFEEKINQLIDEVLS